MLPITPSPQQQLLYQAIRNQVATGQSGHDHANQNGVQQQVRAPAHQKTVAANGVELMHSLEFPDLPVGADQTLHSQIDFQAGTGSYTLKSPSATTAKATFSFDDTSMFVQECHLSPTASLADKTRFVMHLQLAAARHQAAVISIGKPSAAAKDFLTSLGFQSDGPTMTKAIDGVELLSYYVRNQDADHPSLPRDVHEKNI